LVYQHLAKHNHDIKKISIQPLEIVDKQQGQSHKQHEKELKTRELAWIQNLQTAYPLGLNDNIMGKGNISRTSTVNAFDIVSKNNRSKRSHGRRVNRNKRKHHRNAVSFKDLVSIFKNNGRHHLLCKLGTITATKLYSIWKECDTISHYSPLYEAALIIFAFCSHKLFPKIDKPENRKRQFLKIPYINKGIDLIDLASIFRHPKVTKQIPSYYENIEPPILSYTYKKPTRGVIFNYTDVTKDSEINSNCPDSCDCLSSNYRYEPCGHVITGDLNIVKDREVIAFLKKGPKYRPAAKINWTECRDAIEKSLRAYCRKWIKKEISDKSCKKGMDNFMKIAMEIVDICIKTP